jgi:hypothetical protein
MKKLKEIGIGSFRPGRQPNGSHIKSNNLAGPSANADSTMSQRMQYNVGNYEYNDDISHMNLGDEEDELDLEDEDGILECRVYKRGKYCLVETLEKISEIDADDINMLDKKLSSTASARSSMVSNLPDLDDLLEEDELSEFSGAGAAGGGPAVPIGYTAKGKPETPAQRRKRQRFNITKSFPYNKLANPPQLKKRRKNKK